MPGPGMGHAVAGLNQLYRSGFVRIVPHVGDLCHHGVGETFGEAVVVELLGGSHRLPPPVNDGTHPRMAQRDQLVTHRGGVRAQRIVPGWWVGQAMAGEVGRGHGVGRSRHREVLGNSPLWTALHCELS